MTIEDVLRETKHKVRNAIPAQVQISDVEFEGALVVIYTSQPEAFADLGDAVRHLAKVLQKRIVVRPDAKALKPIDEADKLIRQILPEDVELTNLYWEPDIGEVTIEVAKPGRAIGAGGSVLNDLKREIGWAPNIIRTPPVASRTIQEVRGFIRTMGEERTRILRTIGRRIHRGTSPNLKPWLRLTTLGGYREVGRNASILQTQTSKVLLDLGLPADPASAHRPFTGVGEMAPLESVDCVVVTSGRPERAGYLPWLYEQGYDGPVYCTPPTRDIMVLNQVDYLAQCKHLDIEPAYGPDAIREVIKHTIVINYNETTDVAPDARLTFYNAGHLLGSSVAHFHIGDGFYNLAYTGDANFDRGPLYPPAHNRFPRLEALIMEAVHGGTKDMAPNPGQALNKLRQGLNDALEREGRVLMPVTNAGLGQQMMVALEHLKRKDQLPDVPVYLDGRVWEGTAIHTAYPEFLSDQLRSQVFNPGQNPLLHEMFKRADKAEERKKVIASEGPCIVLAPNSVLTAGPVLEYLHAWAGQAKDLLVLLDHMPKGTLGRSLQDGEREAQRPGAAEEELPTEIKMQVMRAKGFDGHSDRRQLINYVARMGPRPNRLVVQSAEDRKAMELGSALRRKLRVESVPMMNLESLRFR